MESPTLLSTLHQDLDTEPLQLEYCDFISTYVPSNPNAAIIVCADAIELPEERGRKVATGTVTKESLSKFFHNTVEKAKNEFSNRTSTLKRSKRIGAKKATAEEEKQKRYSWNSILSEQQLERTMQNNPSTTMRRDDDASDRSTSTKSSQLTNGSSSNNSTETRSLRSTTTAIGSTSTAAAASVKKKSTPVKPTTTILSLEDRDLVIIDGNDIKESVQNESEVIVVDNPRSVQSQAAAEVDLMDILGKDWPALAGDTAHVLNSAERRSSSGQAMKPNLGELTSRNKSMSIISHLKNSKSSTLPRNGTSGQGGSGGSTNSSFESSSNNSGSSAKKSELSTLRLERHFGETKIQCNTRLTFRTKVNRIFLDRSRRIRCSWQFPYF